MLADLSSRTRLAVSLLAVGLFSGCPDPAGKLDEFEGRPRTDGSPVIIADSGPDAPPLAEIPDINGDFLMGMAVSLSPDQPLWFRVTNVLNDTRTQVDVSIQPLRYDGDHAAVGDPILANDVPISSTGAYTAVLTNAMIPGEANPITGNDLVGNFNVIGQIVSADFVCGDVTGMVTSPATIDVSGTTFALQRITGATLPELVSACPAGGTPDAAP